MQIDGTFSVVAPIDKVWDTLMDFERVAGCLPGARILNKLSDDAYQVGMAVKLGPVTMQYKGLLTVVERDAAGHRAVLGGKAQETRGQGTAEASVTLTLSGEPRGTTRGTVSADLALSGKAAAMGKGVIGSVTEQMMALFARNLQAMLTAPETPAPAGERAAGAPAGGPAAVGVPEPVPAADAVAARVDGTAAPAPSAELPGLPPGTLPPAPAAAGAPAGGSLDAFTLAKGFAADQLSRPGSTLALLAVVACIAYWAGRRSAFRMIRLYGGLNSARA
ncbi:SRPBCC family protein [Arthrobacter sp. UYCu712]|uniref:SRPBCC family protein n=1 Tax=Arthrobacter sp. UYCu712 TaxID=3156340 RepID=UPI00339B1CF5